MKFIGLWACGIALVVGFTAGCGGGRVVEGESTEYPEVYDGLRATDPAPLTSAGGSVTFQASLQRRGDFYLTTSAPTPSFTVTGASGQRLAEDQPLTLIERNDYPGIPDFERSGLYSGSFRVPANTGSRPQEYRLSITIPRTQGSPYRQDLAPLVVPAPSGGQ